MQQCSRCARSFAHSPFWAADGSALCMYCYEVPPLAKQFKLVQAYADGGWALGLDERWMGIEEWQFDRLKEWGIPEVSPADGQSILKEQTDAVNQGA